MKDGNSIHDAPPLPFQWYLKLPKINAIILTHTQKKSRKKNSGQHKNSKFWTIPL